MAFTAAVASRTFWRAVASRKAVAAFGAHPNWQRSEAELREVRKQVTFALIAEEGDVEKVAATVGALFELLQKSFPS